MCVVCLLDTPTNYEGLHLYICDVFYTSSMSGPVLLKLGDHLVKFAIIVNKLYNYIKNALY